MASGQIATDKIYLSKTIQNRNLHCGSHYICVTDKRQVPGTRELPAIVGIFVMMARVEPFHIWVFSEFELPMRKEAMFAVINVQEALIKELLGIAVPIRRLEPDIIFRTPGSERID